jgi:hypothetical protein
MPNAQHDPLYWFDSGFRIDVNAFKTIESIHEEIPYRSGINRGYGCFQLFSDVINISGVRNMVVNLLIALFVVSVSSIMITYVYMDWACRLTKSKYKWNPMGMVGSWIMHEFKMPFWVAYIIHSAVLSLIVYAYVY